MFAHGFRVAAHDGPAESSGRTQRFIIRDGLFYDGQHLLASLDGGKPSLAGQLFPSHQQRYQQGRGKGPPSVVSSLLLFANGEGFSAKILHDPSRDEDCSL